MPKCSKCGIVKPFKDFNKDSNKDSGHRADCRACQKTGRSTWTQRYATGRSNANARKIPFNISPEEYVDLCNVETTCYYCDTDMAQENRTGLGLNRVDSSKGYELSNVKRCCTMCNTIMNNFTKEDLLSRVYKIVKRMK